MNQPETHLMRTARFTTIALIAALSLTGCTAQDTSPKPTPTKVDQVNTQAGTKVSSAFGAVLQTSIEKANKTGFAIAGTDHANVSLVAAYDPAAPAGKQAVFSDLNAKNVGAVDISASKLSDGLFVFSNLSAALANKNTKVSTDSSGAYHIVDGVKTNGSYHVALTDGIITEIASIHGDTSITYTVVYSLDKTVKALFARL
jgi:hypothetical protein